MKKFDLKTATLEQLKKKEKSNKQLVAFFIGIFVVLIIVNIITSIITKKLQYSSASFLVFFFIGLAMKSSNKEIADEIKSREEIIN